MQDFSNSTANALELSLELSGTKPSTWFRERCQIETMYETGKIDIPFDI